MLDNVNTHICNMKTCYAWQGEYVHLQHELLHVMLDKVNTHICNMNFYMSYTHLQHEELLHVMLDKANTHICNMKNFYMSC